MQEKWELIRNVMQLFEIVECVNDVNDQHVLLEWIQVNDCPEF